MAVVAEQWAVKHRAKTLEDLVGNDGVIRQIKGFFKQNQIPRTILITGSTGTAKTTLARILANMVNGLKPDEPNPDLLDYNMAEKNKVEDARGILEHIRFNPRNSYRVLLLDEVHAITRASASIFLKPLEEPPAHTIWILCTDQPQKLLETIRNRSTTFRLTTPTTNDILDLMDDVLYKEEVNLKKLGVTNPDDWLTQIAEGCGCQPRLCISVLHGAVAGLWGGASPKQAIQGAFSSADTGRDALTSLAYLLKGNSGGFFAALKASDSPLGMTLQWSSVLKSAIIHNTVKGSKPDWLLGQLYSKLGGQINMATVFKTIKACNAIKRSVTVDGADEFLSAVEHFAPIVIK